MQLEGIHITSLHLSCSSPKGESLIQSFPAPVFWSIFYIYVGWFNVRMSPCGEVESLLWPQILGHQLVNGLQPQSIPIDLGRRLWGSGVLESYSPQNWVPLFLSPSGWLCPSVSLVCYGSVVHFGILRKGNYHSHGWLGNKQKVNSCKNLRILES